MAEQKKKKGRKAYLNDFKKNQEGVYTYEGEHYVWQGTAASLILPILDTRPAGKNQL